VSVIEAAPAKINLALSVIGKRDDGYHLIDSLVVFTAHGDSVTAAAADTDRFTLSGPFARQLPSLQSADNLCIRARDGLRLFLRGMGHPAPPVALKLIKNLPVASGIGGGSADAAATLRCLLAHWRFRPDTAPIAALALTLGADVPMCLASRAARATGIGECLEPVAGLSGIPLVLVNPGVAVGTREVFRRLTDRQNPPLPPIPAFSGPVDLARWLSETRNDLERPARALAPSIGDCLARITESGALAARMSGSGASCFGIYGDMNGAMMAAGLIGARHPGWFVAATRTL